MKDCIVSLLIVLISCYATITLCQWSSTKVEVWDDGEKVYGNFGRRVTLVEVLGQQKKWLEGYKIR